MRVSPFEVLTGWSVKNKISGPAIKGLLQILRQPRFKEQLAQLPKDNRTLLRTLPKVEGIQQIAGGEYYHFDLFKDLRKILEAQPHLIDNPLKLMIRIDGIKLTKSTSACMWPILGYVVGSNCPPFEIGIFAGNKKPNDVDAFYNTRDLVQELTKLKEDRITFNGKTQPVFVKCIADAPARQMLKKITAHNGHSGCERLGYLR